MYHLVNLAAALGGRVKTGWDAMNGRVHRWLDGFAIGASAVCFIHCLAVPLLIAALPVFAGMLDFHEDVHRAIFALALPTSALALLTGHRRHGQITPAAGGSLGLLLLATGLMAGRSAEETALTVSGSLLLALAHLLNWRMSARLH